MSSELHHTLLSAVSPFDQGVSALKLKILRNAAEIPSRPNRTAAVLVPVLDKPEPEILLTVRSELLLHHPGQVSFPGGRIDPAQIRTTDLRDSYNDALLASIRKQLRKNIPGMHLQHKKPFHIPCVFSAEPIRYPILACG